MDETLQMLKDLTEAPGVPGQEDPANVADRPLLKLLFCDPLGDDAVVE